MDRLYSDMRELLNGIPSDFGGGCSLRKAYLLAWLIRKFDLKNTLDIGVYRGRSFFPQALAHAKFTKGVVYGVDPWDAVEASEIDTPELAARIEEFVEKTDFEEIYRGVLRLRQRMDLENRCSVLRETSAEAARLFNSKGVFFDLIHVDGNHDTKSVMGDVTLYLPRLNSRGFILLDDISWSSVRPAYQFLQARLKLVYQSTRLPDDYAIFWDCPSHLDMMRLRAVLWYVDYLRPSREYVNH
jgi:Methyltransferase domain